MQNVRKSAQMLRVEQNHGGRALEKLLPELINEKGFSEAASELGVNKATLNYWLLKFQIRIERIALAPGETFTITRSN